MEQLTLKEKVGPNYVLLELSGALNAYTVQEFQEKVYRYIVDTNVVVDLSQVYSIDSSGLGIFMAGHNDGLDYGTKFYLQNPSEGAKKAIDSTGFEDTFNFIHSVTEVV